MFSGFSLVYQENMQIKLPYFSMSYFKNKEFYKY